MSDALQVHGPLSRGVFAAPASDVPSAPPGVDKVVHVALFAALGLTGRWAGVGRSVLAGLLVLYAAVSEVVQGLSGLDRSASVADWLADVAGLLLGLAVWQLVTRRTRAPR